MTRLLILGIMAGGVLATPELVRRFLSVRMVGSAPTVDGGRLLIFSQPGCAGCEAQMRILDTLSESDRRMVEVVSVADDPAIAAAWRIRSVPATVAVDPDGNAKKVALGVQPIEVVERLLRTIVQPADHAGHDPGRARVVEGGL